LQEDREKVNQYLNLGADINFIPKSHTQNVLKEVLCKDEKMTDFLLSKNIKITNDPNLLSNCIRQRYNNFKVIKILLERGVKPSTMHLREVIANCTSTDLIDNNGNSYTPYKEVLLKFLPHMKQYFNSTEIHRGFANGWGISGPTCSPIITHLLKAGAKPNIDIVSYLIDQKKIELLDDILQFDKSLANKKISIINNNHTDLFTPIEYAAQKICKPKIPDGSCILALSVLYKYGSRFIHLEEPQWVQDFRNSTVKFTNTKL
jgi:hypothetical protein